MKYSHIDLCSGIGGFALGFEWAGLSQPVLFCDTDPWCRKILKQHWPNVPVAEDVKELADDPEGLIPNTDRRETILTAGYPCQPFSQAGKRLGSQDDRHIWPYIRKIVAQKRPAFCIFENVYGHISMGLDQALFDLEADNYASRTFVVPACGVDAPHRRNRVWIVARNVAYTNSLKRWAVQKPQGRRKENPIKRQSSSNSSCDMAYTFNEGSQRRLHRRQDAEGESVNGHSGCSSAAHRQPEERKQTTQRRLGGMADGIPDWMDEPRDIPRVSKGVPNRANRLKGLGNAIVPQISMKIAESILKEMQPDSKK